jgi:hypothetical protein
MRRSVNVAPCILLLIAGIQTSWRRSVHVAPCTLSHIAGI